MIYGYVIKFEYQLQILTKIIFFFRYAVSISYSLSCDDTLGRPFSCDNQFCVNLFV